MGLLDALAPPCSGPLVCRRLYCSYLAGMGYVGHELSVGSLQHGQADLLLAACIRDLVEIRAEAVMDLAFPCAGMPDVMSAGM